MKGKLLVGFVVLCFCSLIVVICYISRLTDKVFGPATTTRHVYDVAAQHVVSGAMEGINGNVFAINSTYVY